MSISVLVSSRYLYSIVSDYFTSHPAITSLEPTPLPKKEESVRVVHGIHLRENSDDPKIVICSNRSFTSIHKATKNLSENKKEELGYFYYCPEKKAICCDLRSDYGIAYPKSSQMPSLLKASRKQPLLQQSSLLLSNGSCYSEKTFVENPLFKNTLERHSVFQELCRLQSQNSFKKDYQYFLDVIQSNNPRWAEAYRSDPSALAYLSLYAYLNAAITKEELLIVHMLASAFSDSPGSADYCILSRENVKDQMRAYSYLSEKNIDQDFYCLRHLDKKSLIERTSIFYQSQENSDLAAYTTIIDRGGEHPHGVVISHDREKRRSITICFFPPWLCKRLYAELYPTQSPPIDHEEFFGYRTRVDDLVLGRPISYASPLFYLPQVHNLEGTQLSVTAHDMLYHCLLDWRHPHAHKLIKLGQKVREMGRESLELAVNILDRPLIGLSSCQDTNIADHLKKYSFVINKFSEEKQAMFFVHCKEIFGESVIEKMFSSDHFDQKFRP